MKNFIRNAFLLSFAFISLASAPEPEQTHLEMFKESLRQQTLELKNMVGASAAICDLQRTRRRLRNALSQSDALRELTDLFSENSNACTNEELEARAAAIDALITELTEFWSAEY